MTKANNILISGNECCGTNVSLSTQSITLNNETSKLPVAVIGGGPVGLAAAAHLAKNRIPFILIEAGSQIGANILTWGHVRLFSPWQYNVDKVAKDLLNASGWIHPGLESLPTGQELVEQYLQPLAMVPEIKPFVHLNTKVLSIGRKDMDKMKTANRESVPFIIHTESNTEYKTFEAKAVIDATGTWGNPNPVVSSGVYGSLKKNLSRKKYSMEYQIFLGRNSNVMQINE